MSQIKQFVKSAAVALSFAVSAGAFSGAEAAARIIGGQISLSDGDTLADLRIAAVAEPGPKGRTAAPVAEMESTSPWNVRPNFSDGF